MNAAERLDTQLAVGGTATTADDTGRAGRGVVAAFLHWLVTGRDPYLWPARRSSAR